MESPGEALEVWGSSPGWSSSLVPARIPGDEHRSLHRAHKPWSLSPAAFENLFQDQRLVVLFIARAIHKGDRMRFAFLLEQLEGVFFLAELLPVAALELPPPGGVVAKPFSQLRARGHIFQPQVHRRMLFSETARPQPVDQNPQAILSGRLFVNSFQLDH